MLMNQVFFKNKVTLNLVIFFCYLLIILLSLMVGDLTKLLITLGITFVFPILMVYLNYLQDSSRNQRFFILSVMNSGIIIFFFQYFVYRYVNVEYYGNNNRDPEELYWANFFIAVPLIILLISGLIAQIILFIKSTQR
ncbi:hypothetical protein D7Z26_10235 [Cohnella endophytica]|uniref:Uncharacterized protein n=1 Tax=Cohnella endophytica TaxID=2419778 RepID=A0A494XYG8_9BACL|nr:hypothetical protein D7Z26_10235 [Cohnella endophytica]